MERTGDRLKKIRLEKGLSLEEVHKRTKVHINVLRAIEDDSFVNLNPVYVKGFLKIYCQFLGEDPADYITDYREPRQRVVVTDEQPAQVRSVQTAVRAASSAVPAQPKLPLRRQMTFPVLKPATLTLIASIVAGCVVVLLLIFLVRVIGAGVSSWSAKRKAARPQTAAVVMRKTPVRSKSQPAQSVPVTQPSAAVVPAPAAQVQVPKAASSETGVIRLGIRAKEDCWLQVRVDGKTVFQSILNRGRLEGWEASNKIELTLGDAGKVDLEINGSRIPALGRKGQPVKNVLITREGLKVGK